MTPMKSSTMIKGSLEKAFMCKNNISWSWFIPNGVSCCSHVCYGTSQPFILGLGEGGEEGGGGGSKNGKTKSYTRKEGEKIGAYKEAWQNVYASLTYFWDLYNGNVKKEILIFLILFEWKVLHIVLPDIK